MTFQATFAIDAAIGMRLAQSGRLAEALPFLDRANRNSPAEMPVLHALATILQRSGRQAEAVERYRAAALATPGAIDILAGLARALLFGGQPTPAMVVLEEALDTDAAFADSGGKLEILLHETGDADAACDLLRPLVEQRPIHAGLIGQYAKALLAAERIADAQGAYEWLRHLRPDDPMPRVELGRMAVSRGEAAAATAHFRAALDIAPDYAAALWEAAQLRDWRLEPVTLARVEHLTKVEADPRALAGLYDLLARHHDGCGEFDATASHAERANSLLAQVVRGASRYDVRRHEAEIDITVRGFTPQLFRRLRSAGDPQLRPVFVIGLPRSGTTLLEQILASHPRIIGVGEQVFARQAFNGALSRSQGSLALLELEAVAEAAAWHQGALQERAQRLGLDAHADRIVDKMPDNYLLAGWLHIAFPNAAIIHCLRDPRDVALSCWLTQFADQKWSHNLQQIVHRIEQHRKLMRHWRAVMGSHLTEVRYERLVANPEAELRHVLAAVRMDWNPAMLAFSEQKEFVASASRQQVREQLHHRSVGRWRNYEAALQPILPRLQSIVAQDASDATRPGGG